MNCHYFSRSFLDFFFPKRCVGCRVLGKFLCETCIETIPLAPLSLIHEADWALDGLFMVAPYQKGSLLQTAIKTMKYRHAPELGDRLGFWMANRLSSVIASDLVLVPVPLHPDRERKRGYNQARLLANGVALNRQIPVKELLRRTRYTCPQAEMSRKGRLRNLQQAFSLSANSAMLNKKVILIDDVCSTGATLNECARALKTGGVQEVWGCVLARG
jgi:ComF family protein